MAKTVVVLAQGSKRWCATIMSSHVYTTEWDVTDYALRQWCETITSDERTYNDTKEIVKKLADERMANGWTPVANTLVENDARSTLIPRSLFPAMPEEMSTPKEKCEWVIDTSRFGVLPTIL